MDSLREKFDGAVIGIKNHLGRIINKAYYREWGKTAIYPHWLDQTCKKKKEVGSIEKVVRRMYSIQEGLVNMIRRGKIEEISEKEDIINMAALGYKRKSEILYSPEDLVQDYARVVHHLHQKNKERIIRELVLGIPNKFLSEEEKDRLLISYNTLSEDIFSIAFTRKVFGILGRGEKNRGKVKVYEFIITKITNSVRKAEIEKFRDKVFDLATIICLDRGQGAGESFGIMSGLYEPLNDFYQRYQNAQNPAILIRLMTHLGEKVLIDLEGGMDLGNLYLGDGVGIDTGRDRKEMIKEIRELKELLKKRGSEPPKAL